MALKNFPYSELSPQQMAEIGAAIAEELASACNIDNQSVVDLQGKAMSVTITPVGTVSAFVTEVTGSSANELAARLYSSSFRDAVVNSTLTILGSGAGHFSIGAISVKPEAFVPLMPTATETTTTLASTVTTTAAATTTTVATTTVATTTGATTSATRNKHKDDDNTGTEPSTGTEPTSMASIQAAALPWPLVICLGLAIGGGHQQL